MKEEKMWDEKVVIRLYFFLLCPCGMPFVILLWHFKMME